MKQRILFVCLGNICRSPLAEGIFIQEVEKRGLSHKFEADSCGTGGWHVGDLPDYRSRQVATENGFELTHRARQLKTSDADSFDWIIAMDDDNYREIINRLPSAKEKIRTMMSFSSSQNHPSFIPDPYYGDIHHFREVYGQLSDVIGEFLEFLNK